MTNTGDLASALRSADAALARFTDPAQDWHWRFLYLKAEILMRQGSYQGSLELLNADLPSVFEKSDFSVWRRLTQGSALAYLSRFRESEAALNQAQALAESAQPALLGEVMLRKGTLALLRADSSAARVLYRKALDLAKEHKDRFLEIAALGSLGLIATRLEHYDESLDWNKQALQLSQSVAAMGSVTRIEGNIGWNYSMVGDFESAEDSYKEAEAAAARAGLPGARIYWLNALGSVYYQQGRYQDAEAASNRALALARAMDSRRTLTECLNTLSEIELATGRLDLAEQHNLEAAAIENAGLDRSGIPYSQLVAGRIAAGKNQFAQAKAIFQKLLAAPSVETPVKWQAQSRLALVYAAEKQPAMAERQFRRAIASIQDARGFLQREEFRVSFLAGAIQFYDAYVDFLVARGRDVEALSIADLSRARALAHGLAGPTASPSESFSLPVLRKLALRFRSSLLFYSLGEQHSYLWVIAPTGVALFPLPPEREISKLVKSYREAILNSPADPLAESDSPAAKLYSLLVAPAAKLIPRNSRVITLPDGALDTFNFETLVVPSSQPHYWIEDVTITNANSLALLDRSNSIPAPRNPNLLLVGNAVSADPSFPPLPQASAEISRVESYFPEKSRFLLTGAAATPAAYLQSDPARYTYLHFVTHGIASRLQPLESAVVLSPSGDSYKLYAREIITRPLRAYLVTISACNGAGNRAYAGEGLVGLSWAFLRAGARNVISALWEVSDASTPQLMNSLYEGLHRGEDPATALRNAKLGLLRSNTIYKKPFYWAPFQLYSGS